MASEANSYFILGFGISRAVIQNEICYHCGPDAIPRPYTHQAVVARVSAQMLGKEGQRVRLPTSGTYGPSGRGPEGLHEMEVDDVVDPEDAKHLPECLRDKLHCFSSKLSSTIAPNSDYDHAIDIEPGKTPPNIPIQKSIVERARGAPRVPGLSVGKGMDPP